MARLLVKIDKCEYCNKNATWIYISGGFITMRVVLVCDEHRMMYSNEIKRI